MQKLAKRLSVFMAAIMTLSLMLNFVMAAPAKAATIYPQVQYATEPQLEYEVGDIVNFDLHTPNYGGRVQYRVVLWNDETKSYKDLWTDTPDRYYTNWMPYGNNIFNLHWKIDVAGHYRITIYAKRAGIPNNECYLKGFNCDSYMESDSFVVKAKEVAVTPDIASEKIELASLTSSPAAINGHISKSAQSIIGKDYELAVKVDKPGVKVMFQLDAPDGSLNKDEVLEAVSGSDNVAKVSYKRLYADADYVTAYVAAAPTVRTAMKVYWGVDKILDITATVEDAVSAPNGNVKSYKVTLKNPITGERMRDRELLVLVRENIDAPSNAALSTALITNPYSGLKSPTYQRMNNIVTGGLNQELVILKTNDNGEAAFTVTGINTKATPVVFFDDDWFYGNPDDRAWGGLADSSQYKPSYAGNNNNRWDATELQAEPATLSFNASTYTFEQTAISDPYTAADSTFRTGRTYTVTITDSEGKPYKNGLVNIAINEFIDNIYNTNTNAQIISTGPDASHLTTVARSYKVQATTGSKGTVSFKIASDKVNDMATPIIWIDQDNANTQFGIRNGILEPADPQKLLSQTTFVESAVKSGSFWAELDNPNLVLKADENDDVISIDGEAVNFRYRVRNQNGTPWLPSGSYANVTYTIQNVGTSPLKVYYPIAGGAAATGVTVDNQTSWPGTVTIPTYQTKTISFRTYTADNNYISIVADGNAMVNVTANANLVTETNTAGAWLAPATSVASWVETTEVKDYAAARNMFSGTIFGYDITGSEEELVSLYDHNYMIVVPATDTSSYVKVPYFVSDVYSLTTPQHNTPLLSDIEEFENQITVDDSLTYKYQGYSEDEIRNICYISLYNADNSWEEVEDETIPEIIPPVTPVLDIDAVVVDGNADVTTYTQTTIIDVITGTDSSYVGNIWWGDKPFTPESSMSTYAVAQMIANASPITIDGVSFEVELDGVLGGLKFTGTVPNTTEIDIMAAYYDPNNTGIQIELETSAVNPATVNGEQEKAIITVNNAAPKAQTVMVKFSDGDAVSFESYFTVVEGDSAQIIATKIKAEFDYWLGGIPGYNVTIAGNQVTITRLANTNAGFQILVQ